MESISNIINDIERDKYPSMINDSPKKPHPLKVEDIAQRLVDVFKSEKSWKFYCLVANNLDQSTIDRLTTQATEKGNCPGALFNYLARKEMGVLEDHEKNYD